MTRSLLSGLARLADTLLSLIPVTGITQGQVSPAALQHAGRLWQSAPLIDGHNDLPWLIREESSGDVGAFHLKRRNQNVTLDRADAALGEQRRGGLTEFGRAMVREMNRIGMVVDPAHVCPATMHQALGVARAPDQT